MAAVFLWTVFVVVVTMIAMRPRKKVVKEKAVQTSSESFDGKTQDETSSKTHVEAADLNELTVEAIRDRLRKLDASLRGSKAELIERLVKFQSRAA